MKLFRVILPVSDIERAQSFYSAIFGQAGNRVSPGRHYFDCGGTILACYDPLADGDDADVGWKPHTNQFMYLSTRDLDSALAAARNAGAESPSPIQTMPWGERLFYAQDPFGNQISFVDEKTIFAG